MSSNVLPMEIAREAGLPISALLIEDNPDDVELIQEALREAEGNRVSMTWADTLTAGLSQLASGEFDVVLADLGLPDSQGLDTFLRVRSCTPDLPIIILTGMFRDQIAFQALREGAQDFLIKGEVAPKLLSRVLRYAIERKRTENQLRDLNGELRKRAQEQERTSASLRTVSQELERTNETLQKLILVDPLTELHNRRGMQAALSREIQWAGRSESTLHAVLLDLDDFKRVNDSLGHAVGDVVLKEVGRRLKASLRSTDYAGRIGGDEFLLLLPAIRPAEAMRAAEKVRLAVSQTPLELQSGPPLRVTASLGLVAVARSMPSIDELLSQADVNLRRSKWRGKDRVSCEEGAKEKDPRAEIVSALRRGDLLHPEVQPIVRLSDGQAVGFEFLCRFSFPSFELPDAFFRVCLEEKILTLVDHHCFRLSAAAASALPSKAWVHLNLFPSTLIGIPTPHLLESLGPDRDWCVEISEQQIIGEPSYLLEAVQALKRAGVRVALDDIGFGRSCLESLVLLEPQIVKIDKACVIGLGENPGRVRSFERLLRVARTLGSEIVAEGIQSEEDLRVVRDLGVEFGQGFFLGKPVPPDVLTASREEQPPSSEGASRRTRQRRAGGSAKPTPRAPRPR